MIPRSTFMILQLLKSPLQKAKSFRMSKTFSWIATDPLETKDKVLRKIDLIYI